MFTSRYSLQNLLKWKPPQAGFLLGDHARRKVWLSQEGMAFHHATYGAFKTSLEHVKFMLFCAPWKSLFMDRRNGCNASMSSITLFCGKVYIQPLNLFKFIFLKISLTIYAQKNKILYFACTIKNLRVRRWLGVPWDFCFLLGFAFCSPLRWNLRQSMVQTQGFHPYSLHLACSFHSPNRWHKWVPNGCIKK